MGGSLTQSPYSNYHGFDSWAMSIKILNGVLKDDSKRPVGIKSHRHWVNTKLYLLLPKLSVFIYMQKKKKRHLNG